MTNTLHNPYATFKPIPFVELDNDISKTKMLMIDQLQIKNQSAEETRFQVYKSKQSNLGVISNSSNSQSNFLINHKKIENNQNLINLTNSNLASVSNGVLTSHNTTPPNYNSISNKPYFNKEIDNTNSIIKHNQLNVNYQKDLQSEMNHPQFVPNLQYNNNNQLNIKNDSNNNLNNQLTYKPIQLHNEAQVPNNLQNLNFTTTSANENKRYLSIDEEFDYKNYIDEEIKRKGKQIEYNLSQFKKDDFLKMTSCA